MPTFTSPLGHEIAYRGMTGKDEDILTNRKKVQSGEGIIEILANCTISIDGKSPISTLDIDKLFEPDRRALLFAVRRESYGDELEFEVQCDGCRANFAATFDLGQTPELPLPADFNDETGFDIALSDGTTVRYTYLTGPQERKLMREKNDLLTANMLLRITAVSGLHQNDLRRWLKDLPVALRKELRLAMEARECGPNPQVTVDCTNCGQEHSVIVHQQPSFFFPAK